MKTTGKNINTSIFQKILRLVDYSFYQLGQKVL
jgi:hypothetical protein